MKKSILLMSALFFCGMTALAQEPLYKMKLTLQDGSKIAALTDEIDSMQLTTVKAAEVHVTERYKTSSSIGINIEAEASVTRVQAAIVAGSEIDPNINYTEYVQKHSVCDAKGSYTLAFDFLKSTFGSSVELYDDLLPNAGAISSYLPAAESDVYNQPSEFYGGQTVYKDIVNFAGQVPAFDCGAYYSDVRSALTDAVTNVVQNNADIDSEMQNAQDTVEFNIAG